MRPLSETQFEWIGILAMIGIVVGWGLHDALLLRRHVRAGTGTGDQRFGAIMGLVMVTLGAIGLLLHFMDR